MRAVIRRSTWLVFLALSLGACTESPQEPAQEEHTSSPADLRLAKVARVVVTPSSITLPALKSRARLSAVALDENGRPLLRLGYKWRSLNPNIATITPRTGILTTHATGQVIIEVELGGVFGYALATSLDAGGGAVTWGPMSTPHDGHPWAALGVWGFAANDVWAVGQFNAATLIGFAWHYDGHAWQELVPPTSERLQAVWGPSADDVWVVGDAGSMFRRQDGTWIPVSSGTTANIHAIWGAAPNDIWAAGVGGILLHYDGASWQSAPSPTSQSLYALWGSSANDLWAAGDNGTVLHFVRGTWQVVPVPTQANLRSLWGAGKNALWAVGGYGIAERDASGNTPTILEFNGSGWRVTSFEGQRTLAGILGTSEHRIWAFGYPGTSAAFDGTSWTLEHVSDAFTGHTMWAIQPGIAISGGTGLWSATP